MLVFVDGDAGVGLVFPVLAVAGVYVQLGFVLPLGDGFA